jgi:hypothetical protein
MAKLTYWIAPRLDDGICYSLIGKTKKAVQQQLDQITQEQKGSPWAASFGPIEKRIVKYKDAFDLFDWCTGEGGGRDCGWTED